MPYAPPQEVLDRYASVLVDFALGGGRGVQAGEVVRVVAPESAKPLYAALNRAVWRAGGHVIGAYQPDDDADVNLSRDFYESAGAEQLDYFPARYTRGLIDEIDHQVTVIAPSDPRALDAVDPVAIMRRGETMRPLLDWRGEKENAGRFSWTLALYGTPGMAAEAGTDVKSYWQQIIDACFLDNEDPLARWREVGVRLEETRRWLDELEIERVHVVGEDVDLRVSVGEQRRWLGGRGRNIPSFELFTSPDWRGTEGWIYCNQPLYRYGNLVKGIRLAFVDGLVSEASAEQNELLGETLGRVAQGEMIDDLEMTRKTRDGRLIEVALSVSPVRDARGVVVGAAAAARDITDRKRAQETVGMLAKMLASSREAISLITLEGVISFWSAGSEAMYGYSHAKALGREMSMLIASPAQRAELEGIITRITAGGSVADLETTHLTNDGRVIDVSLSAWPVRDGDGRVVGASMIATNITERKQATAALSEAQDRFRYACEESPVGMVMLDLDLRFTAVNVAFSRIVGSGTRPSSCWERASQRSPIPTTSSPTAR